MLIGTDPQPLFGLVSRLRWASCVPMTLKEVHADWQPGCQAILGSTEWLSVPVIAPTTGSGSLGSKDFGRGSALTQHMLTVQAGDVLFIPEGHWHQVRSSGSSIAVNLWFKSAATQSAIAQQRRPYIMRRLVREEVEARTKALLSSTKPYPGLDISGLPLSLCVMSVQAGQRSRACYLQPIQA